jgi:hypothetical protein
MRGAILRMMNRYLGQEIPLTALVEWAQATLRAGDLSADDAAFLQELTDRAGRPGTKAFGLTLEDCDFLLRRLGHELRVSTGPANGHTGR